MIWSNIPSLWLKKTVTLPMTLLCPATQIDNTFKLGKAPADSSSSSSVIMGEGRASLLTSQLYTWIVRWKVIT